MTDIKDKGNLLFDSRNKNIDECVVGVYGSRSLKDERVKIILLDKIKEWGITKLVTCAEPGGVSEVTRTVAKETAIPLQLHFLNFRYSRGAFEQRSREIIRQCDKFIIIHDKESQGTENEFNQVKKAGRPYHYETLDQAQYDKSVGFDVKEEWDIDDLEFKPIKIGFDKHD